MFGLTVLAMHAAPHSATRGTVQEVLAPVIFFFFFLPSVLGVQNTRYCFEPNVQMCFLLVVKNLYYPLLLGFKVCINLIYGKHDHQVVNVRGLNTRSLVQEATRDVMSPEYFTHFALYHL